MEAFFGILGIVLFFVLLHNMNKFIERSPGLNSNYSAEWFSIIGCLVLCVIGAASHNGIFVIIGGFITICVLSSKNREYKDKIEWERDRPAREERAYQNRIRMEQAEQERKREDSKKNSEEEHRKRVELSAMNKAIAHEKSFNRVPVDVSSQNLGYDLKSSGNNDTLFIEVKGRSDDSGYILMTANEWSKAQELENNYYLYVVTNCDRDQYYQHLYIVANPANRLSSSITSDQKHQIELSEIKQKT